MDAISDVELKHLLETEWEEFEAHSPLSEEKMKTLYEGLHIRSEEVKPRFTLKRYWMQIAASLLLLIAGSLTVLTFMQQNEINALAEQNVVRSFRRLRQVARHPSRWNHSASECQIFFDL